MNFRYFLMSLFIISLSIKADTCRGPYEVTQFTFSLDEAISDCFLDEIVLTTDSYEEAESKARSIHKFKQDFHYKITVRGDLFYWCSEVLQLNNPSKLRVDEVIIWGRKDSNNDICQKLFLSSFD